MFDYEYWIRLCLWETVLMFLVIAFLNLRGLV